MTDNMWKVPSLTRSDKITFEDQNPANMDIIGDRYVFRLFTVENKRQLAEGGYIFLPDTNEDKLGWSAGEVVAIGNGHRLDEDVTVPMFFNVGDIIYASKYTGVQLYFQATEYRIISQSHCYARIKRG